MKTLTTTAKAMPKKGATGGAKKKRVVSADGVATWQKILNVSVLLISSTGDDKAPRKRVAAMCGFPNEKVRTWANSLTKLKKLSFITFDPEFIHVTESGHDHAQTVEVGATNTDQLNRVKDTVKAAKGKAIMDVLSDGGIHSRIAVAQQIGVEGGPKTKGFVNLLSTLKKEGILEYLSDPEGNPALCLTDWLFPLGRPAQA